MFCASGTHPGQLGYGCVVKEVMGLLLPEQINEDTVTERILPTKDVDGFHPYNVGRLALRSPLLRPCTPQPSIPTTDDSGRAR